MNAKIVMVATLGLVLNIGTLTTIHAQQAFALANTNTGINGNICTTNNCNTDGRSSNGGNGGQVGNGENGSP